MLDDVQVAVQHHPVDQIGELAHAAAHAAAGPASAGDHQALPEAPVCGGISHQRPEGEGLPGTDQNPVDAGRCQPQVHCLVLLQLHLHISKPPPDQRRVLFDPHRQQFLLFGPGKVPAHWQDPEGFAAGSPSGWRSDRSVEIFHRRAFASTQLPPFTPEQGQFLDMPLPKISYILYYTIKTVWEKQVRLK